VRLTVGSCGDGNVNVHMFYGATRFEEVNTIAVKNLPEQGQNPVKDPEERMTGPLPSYLGTLLQQVGKSEEELNPDLTKAEASRLIDELRKETGRGR
jgi:hypothetical protein